MAKQEMSRPPEERSRDAGVHILDYAAAKLAAGDAEEAQAAFYDGILLTNDLTLGESAGRASLLFAESSKLWQGEAYERAMIELLHGVALMQLGDFDNARVAFDRAITTDRFSAGAIRGREGDVAKGGIFEPNDLYSSAGGSVYQRDFLAAYVLRTICYLRQNRPLRAAKSWQEAQQVFDELSAAATDCAGLHGSELTWTRSDGRYVYPRVYLPPFDSPSRAEQSVLGLSIDELARVNLVVVAATGSRPLKVRTGASKGGYDVKLVHDGYWPPAEAVESVDVLIDGHYTHPASKCLDLFGQVAGRGPSAKDLAQRRKEVVEDVGEILQRHGIFGLQYVGLFIRAINQEAADVRQWSMLPNAVHIWLGHVEPMRRHTLACVFSGRNAASRDLLPTAPVQTLAGNIRNIERAYFTAEISRLTVENDNCPIAARHTVVTEIQIQENELITAFVPEQFNSQVELPPLGAPVRYELLPRRSPDKD